MHTADAVLVCKGQFPLTSRSRQNPERLDQKVALIVSDCFLLGCSLTGHNWATSLLIDRTSFRRLLIQALLLISVAMSILTRTLSPTILAPGTPAPSAIVMWAETLFSALLALSGCTSSAPPLPVLTFAQSAQLALQWVGVARRAIPKGKLASPLRPVSSLPRLHPLHPLPQGSPHYRLVFINHIHLGPPTLPLLHLFSRGW